MHIGKGGAIGSYTIKSACDSYVDHLVSRGKVSSANDAKTRFESYVLDDPMFASLELTKLTPAHVEAWRRRLRDRPVTSGKNKGGKRSESTLNRDMTPLRAALNQAYGDGHVTSDFAWKKKLSPVPNADSQRKLYLDIDQRRRLIQHAPADLANFLSAQVYWLSCASATSTESSKPSRYQPIKAKKNAISSFRSRRMSCVVPRPAIPTPASLYFASNRGKCGTRMLGKIASKMLHLKQVFQKKR